MSLGSITSRQGLVTLTPPLHAWAIFLNSLFIAHPSFHPLYDAFLHQRSIMSSLLTQSSLLIRLSSWVLEWTALVLGSCCPRRPASFPELLCLSKLCPWDPTYQFPKGAEICCPEVQGLFSATLLPRSLQNLTPSISRWLQPRLLLIPTSPTCSALSVNSRYSCGSTLLGLPSSCFKKLSLMPSRNLLDCWCPAMLFFQQTSGRLNSPMRTSICASEASSSALKRTSSTCSPSWYVCNTLPSRYPPYRRLPWPTGSPPAHHASHWRAPCTRAAPSQRQQGPWPLIFPAGPSWRAGICPSQPPQVCKWSW